jgi:hypothetical protein
VEVLQFDDEPDLLGFVSGVPGRSSRRVFGGDFCQSLGAPSNAAPGRLIHGDRGHPPRLPAMQSVSIDRPPQRPGIRDLHTTPPGHS